MGSNLVKLEIAGGVAEVVMDNPATLNAMDQDLGPRLTAALESLAGEPAARAVILTGGGGHFSAGGNLARAQEHLARHPGQGAAPVFAAYTRWVARVLAALARLEQPVVAAVEGAASGAGLAWMLAADLVVASREARIIPGFVAVGLVPAAGTTWHLPRLAGLQRAGAALMLGRPITPEEALALGLVNRLAPAGEAVAAARELARELAAGPREALAASKRLIRAALRGAGPGLEAHAEDERQAVLTAADQPDFARRAARFAPGAQTRR